MSCAVLATPASPLVIVHSDILGDLTVAAEQVIQFRAGLVGLPECTSFVLIPTERSECFWLQSVEHSALAFLLVDPFLFFDGYAIDLSPVEMAEIGADADSDVVVLTIVTLPQAPGEQATANLQGPLAINLSDLRGKQMIVEGDEYRVRAPFDLD